MNAGFAHAKGDIVALTDADTTVPSDWIEKITDAFTDSTVVALATLATRMELVGLPFFTYLTRYLYPLFISLHFLLQRPHLCGASTAIRLNVIRKVGGLKPEYVNGADLELGLRLGRFGKIVFLSDVTVFSSARRFKKNVVSACITYSLAYLKTVWLRRPETKPLFPVR